jgi:hypothetical protein
LITSQLIDAQIASYPDWRGERLKWFRAFVNEVAPELSEDFKWGVGVFTYNGKPVIAFSGFKDHTKFNFFQGVALDDRGRLFNSGLDSKQHRSINLAEHDEVNEAAITELIRRAVDVVAS